MEEEYQTTIQILKAQKAKLIAEINNSENNNNINQLIQ